MKTVSENSRQRFWLVPVQLRFYFQEGCVHFSSLTVADRRITIGSTVECYLVTVLIISRSRGEWSVYRIFSVRDRTRARCAHILNLLSPVEKPVLYACRSKYDTHKTSIRPTRTLKNPAHLQQIQRMIKLMRTNKLETMHIFLLIYIYIWHNSSVLWLHVNLNVMD